MFLTLEDDMFMAVKYCMACQWEMQCSLLGRCYGCNTGSMIRWFLKVGDVVLLTVGHVLFLTVGDVIVLTVWYILYPFMPVSDVIIMKVC